MIMQLDPVLSLHRAAHRLPSGLKKTLLTLRPCAAGTALPLTLRKDGTPLRGVMTMAIWAPSGDTHIGWRPWALIDGLRLKTSTWAPSSLFLLMRTFRPENFSISP